MFLLILEKGMERKREKHQLAASRTCSNWGLDWQPFGTWGEGRARGGGEFNQLSKQARAILGRYFIQQILKPRCQLLCQEAGNTYKSFCP